MAKKEKGAEMTVYHKELLIQSYFQPH